MCTPTARHLALQGTLSAIMESYALRFLVPESGATEHAVYMCASARPGLLAALVAEGWVRASHVLLVIGPFCAFVCVCFV